jgi:allantoate deiminase
MSTQQQSAAGSGALATAILRWAEELATLSEEAPALTRLYLTPQHREAGARIIGWMRAAGLAAGFDAIGNVVGRYEASEPGRPSLLLGSHIDSVRNAGKYDGTLGVLAAIACVGALHESGIRLPFAIEILAFGDEEGVRFPTTLMGSRAIAGRFDPAWLDLRDRDGKRLADALKDFGLDPDGIPGLARKKAAVLGYVELHIEQGPVLEQQGLPVGIVTAIAGCSRLLLDFSGVAGHAGTVPMGLRHDALAAAAETILAIERHCTAQDSLVGTVGQIAATPGAVNVIPGAASLSLDLRAPDDGVRLVAKSAILARAQEICEARGIGLAARSIHEASSARCSDWLSRQLADAVSASGIQPYFLMSGAGHDAMAMAELTDVAMLFVRCAGGISHNPAESVTGDDVEVGTRALLHFVRHFRPRDSQ